MACLFLWSAVKKLGSHQKPNSTIPDKTMSGMCAEEVLLMLLAEVIF